MPAPGTGPAIGYEEIDATPQPAAEFEPLTPLDPAELLPPGLARSEHHTVVLVGSRGGFAYTYHVQSDFGDFEVESIGLLRQRVHELSVLAALREANVTNEKIYALAVLNAAEGPLEGAAQLVFHPVKTTTRIPKGIWSMARMIYEMRLRERTYLEDHYAEELLGFGKAKREWAYRLGVDPYSANPAVQEMLDHHGWVSFAGGITVRAPLMAIPSGPASYALTIASNTDDMNRELRDVAPEDIRIANRTKLRDMNVPESVLERFLEHPWYSPTRQLSLVKALGELDETRNRASFIEVASHADEPSETFLFMRMAMMLAGYADSQGPIEEILEQDGILMGYTANRAVVFPLCLDFGLWTAQIAELADELELALPRDREVEQKILMISGGLSDRARREFEARGWVTMEDLEQTWLAEWDEKIFAPGQPDENRILPEIGS